MLQDIITFGMKILLNIDFSSVYLMIGIDFLVILFSEFTEKILHRSRKRWIIVSRVANNMNAHLNKVEFIPLFATNEMKMKYVWAWQQHQHKWNYKSYFLDVSFFLLVPSNAISLFLDIIIMLINVCSISRSA